MPTLEQFPPGQLLLSPMAAHSAIEANVLAFGTNLDHMRKLLGLLREHVPGVGPAGNAADLLVVIRRGGRFLVGRDVIFDDALPEQAYVPAERVGIASNEDDPLITKAVLMKRGKQIIELSVSSLRHPRFGSRYAVALMDYGEYPRRGLNGFVRHYATSLPDKDMGGRGLVLAAGSRDQGYNSPISSIRGRRLRGRNPAN